jgi:indole-3-glycerol phosphate synthase
VPELLETIVAGTRCVVRERMRRRPEAVLAAVVEQRQDLPRSLRQSLSISDGHRVIAECKRRSPAKGLLCRDYDPARLAAACERGGAAGISVLTEPMFFDGSIDHLRSARAATGLPVLRKDFIVDRYQLLEAREAGADAVLLIVAALDEAMLKELLYSAQALGLEALVEVHDHEELRLAAGCGVDLIGVNSRNLRTLQVDAATCFNLIAHIPRTATAVAESGIRGAEDVEQLGIAGYRGFLVGERLMTSKNPAASLAELLQRHPIVTSDVREWRS